MCRQSEVNLHSEVCRRCRPAWGTDVPPPPVVHRQMPRWRPPFFTGASFFYRHVAPLQDLGVQFTDHEIQTALEEIDAGEMP